MQRAIIYCRVSSERQKTDGHGLDSQEHRCRDYAERKGYQVVKVFHDSFSGGGDFMRRPAMAKLLVYLDENRHERYVVIFDDLKRFARDIVFHWKLRSEFDQRNTKIECLNHTFEDSPEGRFIETMLASTGQLEREQNKRQVIQRTKARLEQGKYALGGTAPPGYKRIRALDGGATLVLDESMAKIVIEAYEGYASGRFATQEEVRRFLVEKRLRNGKPIYLETVKRMLRRKIYTGYIEFPKWDVKKTKAEHPAIISEELFQRVQDKLEGKVKTHTKRLVNPDFPLRGFVLCSECHSPATASWSRGRNGRFGYYRCKTSRCIERNKSVAKKVVEEEFEKLLEKIRPSPQILNLTKAVVHDIWAKKEKEMSDKRKLREGELREIVGAKEKLMQRLEKAENEHVIQSYEKRLGELTEKEAVLTQSITPSNASSASIETALDIVFEFLNSPLKRWENGDMQTKRLVLRLVFEERLAYNKNSGFETAILSLPLRVFTLPEAQKSSVVEVVGIEPTSEEMVPGSLHG